MTASDSLFKYSDGYGSLGDILPYGTKAIWRGYDISNNPDIGNGKYAFVLDTGINLANTSVDLNINTTWAKSFVPDESALNDLNGHGTHVSGTIGAKANGSGIVGVCPGAEIVPIKVLSNSGSGLWSYVEDGINYCVDIINENNLKKSDVVLNLSLSGYTYPYIDNVLKSAADQGINIVVAAGNNASDVDYASPAGAGDHSNVYTISAANSSYEMAYLFLNSMIGKFLM